MSFDLTHGDSKKGQTEKENCKKFVAMFVKPMVVNSLLKWFVKICWNLIAWIYPLFQILNYSEWMVFFIIFFFIFRSKEILEISFCVFWKILINFNFCGTLVALTIFDTSLSYEPLISSLLQLFFIKLKNLFQKFLFLGESCVHIIYILTGASVCSDLFTNGILQTICFAEV